MILRTLPQPNRSLVVIRRELARQPGLPFADLLPERHILQAVRDSGASVRQRVFTPAVTLWTFLSQVLDADHSCRQAVARFNAWRVAVGLAPVSADNSAYCKARARLPEDVLHQLVRGSGYAGPGDLAGDWLWRGRHVKVVDGTGLSMPDTEDNQKAYPRSPGTKAGVGFPLLRLVAIFSLANGAVLDAAMGPFVGKKTGEISLFRRIDQAVAAGDVLLADRLYATFWEVARLQRRGVDVIMRMHAGRKAVRFRCRGHAKGNRRVWWTKPQRPKWMSEEEYESYPKEIRLRALRIDVRRRGSRVRRLVLVTTLVDARAVTMKDIGDLYRRRWQVEVDLRSLKTTMQMDILRGMTPALVRKEVWAHLLAYNLLRRLMARAALARAVPPETLSVAGTLQTVNAFLPYLLAARTPEEHARLCAALDEGIATHRVGDRPDRYEPRKVKRRPKNYARLRGPRAEERRRLRNGTSEEISKT
jgi:Transposase DDE domain